MTLKPAKEIVEKALHRRLVAITNLKGNDATEGGGETEEKDVDQITGIPVHWLCVWKTVSLLWRDGVTLEGIDDCKVLLHFWARIL